MQRFRISIAAACLAVTLPAMAQAERGGKQWVVPTCDVVQGTGAVTFTNDEGATLRPTSVPLYGTNYTAGLVALPKANNMLAVHQRSLYRSTTAGCRWSLVGTLTSVSDRAPVVLTASTVDRAYGWSDNRPDLMRIDGKSVTYLQSPTDSIVGFGADPADGNRARLGSGDGSLFETRDGGSSWVQIGVPPAKGIPIYYRAAFDPANLDHVVFGTVNAGTFVSFDGGATWSQSTGLSSVGNGAVNVFNGIVSPADPSVVYVMGLDIVESDAGAPSGGRHIYRSEDGGLTFAPVVDRSAEIVLINGPLMAGHPTDSNVVYFVFGDATGDYGTDLFRYDHLARAVTKTHNAYDQVDAIAFNPADPGTMYLGLSIETIR